MLIIILISIFGINYYVKKSARRQILKEDEYSKLSDVDCIIVLGAAIWGDKPSPMLEDRILEGIKLYENNVSNKILMSGDHSRNEYDEVNIMKNYAIQKGVSSEDIFMDHAGFSTYESIYRAKEIFGAKKIIIVTQEYHLYRALYIANQLGIEAYGVGADPRQYAGATYRELREILARDKDFVKCIFKPEPKYLGDAISISSNGDITNDKKNEINSSKVKVKDKKKKALELMNDVGLSEELAKRKILRLSGGEQQRIAIARSLSYDPKIIIADEPTGNLDKDTENEILNIFENLAKKKNKCIIIVTHSQNVCDRADIIYELKKKNNIHIKIFI